MTTNVGEQEKRTQLFVIWLAGVFILAGLVFGANSQGLLPEITSQWDKVEWAEWVLLGAGLWGLAINVFRVKSPDWPLPNAFDWIATSGMTIAGASEIFQFDVEVGDLVGAVAMVALGVVILFTTLRSMQK